MAIASFLYLFVLMGTTNCLGVFLPSICADNGFTVSQGSVMFTCAGIAAAGVGMLLTPTILKKLQPRGSILIGLILYVAQILWYSFGTTIVEFYIAACLGGAALGIGGIASCGALVGNWFVAKRAQVTGIVMAGAGLGSACLQAISGILIEALGYRAGYRVVAIIVAVVGIIVLLVLRNKPEDVKQKPLGYELLAQTQIQAQDKVSLPGVAAKKAFASPAFWFGIGGMALGNLAYTFCGSYVVTLLTDASYGVSTSVAAYYSAILGLVSAVYLILNGKLFDKLGFGKYIVFTGVAAAAGSFIFGLTGSKIVGLPWLIIIAVVLCSFSISRQNADAQTTAATCFGMRDFTSIQAYLAASANAGAIFMAVIVSGLLNSGSSLAFCFTVFGIILLLSMVCLLLAKVFSPLNKKANNTAPTP